jgi:predicted peptidase
MKTHIAAVLALALTSSTSLRAADQKPGTQVATRLTVSVVEEATKKDVEVRYLQFLPEDYKSEGEEKPVILFLHGSGERGTDIELVKKWGPPRIAEKQKDFSFIVISPQCPSGRGWDTRELLPLVEHTCKTLNADPDRVYVTGLSMGGYGTWELIAAAPKRFAAGMPLCGRGDLSKAAMLIGTPIHTVIGGQDRKTTNDAVRELVEAVKAAGGKNIELTIHEDLGHNVWSKTYGNPETWKWLLSHKRANR